ncbi:MAG: AraC family ligand binding domain-containing protein [Eubacteriales bacterium]
MVEINKIKIDFSNVSAAPYCDGDISGLHPRAYMIPAGNSVEFPAECGYYHIIVKTLGQAVFTTDGKDYSCEERLSFVPAPDKSLTVRAVTDTFMMEFRFDTKPEDAEDLKNFGTEFPVFVPYQQSIQYLDPHKSQKTISRMMIPHKIIPRFTMGSVESFGYDIVNPHAHPMLDQLFYSFPENKMDLLIDGERYPMGSNEIMHIPLGSNHGVEVTGEDHLHYMWIDVMPDQAAGLKRLESSHKPTGLNRAFESERN